MAGVTINGFVPKRMNEIITGLKDQAKPIFQDLVKPGDEVDTGDTSTIGRLIGLIAPDLDELWQAAQQVYQAFDPNSATGVALDNIVQYIGITRRQGAPTVLRASVWGTTNTFMPQGQYIRGDEGNQFVSTIELTFSTDDFIGFAIQPIVAPVGDVVAFTMITAEGIVTLSKNSDIGDTSDTIMTEWMNQYNAAGQTSTYAYIADGKFYVVLKQYFDYVTVPSVTSASLVEVKKRLAFNSVDFGDIPAPINTVTTMLTPVFGWLSVTNEISAEKGSVYETDEELRERFRVSKAVRANNTSEALYSQLLELPDVELVRVYENMTNAVDLKGLPPHSFMAIVRGGVDTDIGEIVWHNKPLGIGSHGAETVTIRDSQNLEREVHFNRATDVPVYVNVVVKKTDNTFPDNGADQIRTAIYNYVKSTAAMGENVIYTRFFTPVNSIPGHQVDVLKIGKTLGTMGTSNIALTWSEYPITAPEFITVTVAP